MKNLILFLSLFNIKSPFVLNNESNNILYLYFPKNGKKYDTKELVSYNKVTKKRIFRKESLYHFPCRTVTGDFRFITVDEKNAKHISQKLLNNLPVKGCRWISTYKGNGLNQYNQNPEFSKIYIIEKYYVNNNYKLVEVKPEMREYN